nr:helix-turn-helix domain-containing protein [Allomuricauda sp.]
MLHGITFATYLCFFKKRKTLPNYLLAMILIFMAFRIGKSVLLNFNSELEPVFIFAGLAFLLLIGPLLRWYVCGMTQVDYKLPKYYLWEFVPFILVFVLSFFIAESWFENADKEVIIFFGSILIAIYLHLAFYIFIAATIVKGAGKKHPQSLRTKSQKAIFQWLSLILIGFVVIWISYALNIIEDTVPYIVGPIMYSLAIYYLSFRAFQLKITDLDGSVFKESDHAQLFHQLSSLVKENKLYLEPDVSLASLSKKLQLTTQKTSEVINQYAKQNFNDFINHFRIEEAKKLLQDPGNQFTISAIAFDCGFNSLSSFNTAFKKFEGVTPSAYKKNQS